MWGKAVKTLNILILEDHLETRELHKRIFADHIVHEADTFADGIQKATELHPNIILTDLRLIDSLEHETASKISLLRHASPLASILVVSGFINEDLAKVALHAGADMVLEKDELLTSRLLAAIEASNEPAPIAKALDLAKKTQRLG